MRGLRPTIRLRLTLWWAGLFLVFGSVLLATGYALTQQQLSEAPGEARAEIAERLGLSAAELERINRLRLSQVAPEVGDEAGEVEVSDVVDQVIDETATQALAGIRRQLRGMLVMLAVASGLAGWFLAGRMLRPIREIASTARSISEERLDLRLDLSGPRDELRELAEAFDGMLDRLERSFAAQQEFVARASHELRTPLTLMRTELDVTLADPEVGPDELEEMATELRRAIGRSERVIDRLLVLARSGQLETHEPVALALLAEEVIEDRAGLADDASLALELDLQPAHAWGDPTLIERAVANLVENAIRHNQPGGWFRVETRTDAGKAIVSVSNGGETIAPDELEGLIEPFARRGAGRPGSGLGLSIVRAVANAHDGELRLRARPDGGLDAELHLPAAE